MANGWTRFTGGDDMRGAGIGLGIAALLLGAVPVSAQDAGTGSAMASTDQMRLDATGAIGRLIFDYDRAAWVATDAMMAAIPAAELPKTGGWVVLPRADGALVVTFYEGTQGQGRGYFDAVVKDGDVIEQKVVAISDRRPLSQVQQRMADAWKVAMMRSGHQPCAQARFNSVVLPPATDEAPVTVYLLTPQVQRGVYPFGGHYRVDVDKDGKIVVDRAFTRSCLAMESGGDRSDFMVVTHLLDPMPTEMHVFLSIWIRKPIMVSTMDGRNWAVVGDRIAQVPNDRTNARAR